MELTPPPPVAATQASTAAPGGLRSAGGPDVLARRLCEQPSTALLSSDVFDTVLLRDGSTETQRLASAAERAARVLGQDPRVLACARWDLHDQAYRAVAMERPDGDASLDRICVAVAAVLGLGEEAARVLHDAEVSVDAEHLRPHRQLLAGYAQARRSGLRVVATSDTYYSAAAVRALLERVVGEDPFDEVRTSSDLGATKHRGGLFPVVADLEGVAPAQVLHVGDHAHADVERAIEAGWGAHHLPRGGAARARRLLGALASAPSLLRRAR